MKNGRMALISAGLIIALAGCGDENEMVSDQPGSAANNRAGALTLELRGLEALQNGFHYEGWAIIDTVPVSTGKFNLNQEGEIIELSQGGSRDDLDRATQLVITVEPAGDSDAVPAATKILSGSLTNGQAELRVAPEDALGDNFEQANGSYILATPTDGSMNSNETSGVWFLRQQNGMPMPALSLPMLPMGWTYEGWVVLSGIPLSTGKFMMPNQADMSAMFSGNFAGPPFPGEDFLKNAPSGLSFPANLGGGDVVITIEPEPDDSTAPFALKPLKGTVPGTPQAMQPYTLENLAASLASGKAQIIR